MSTDAVVKEQLGEVATCLRESKFWKTPHCGEGSPDSDWVQDWYFEDDDQKLLLKDCEFAYHWGRFVGIAMALDMTPGELIDSVEES